MIVSTTNGNWCCLAVMWIHCECRLPIAFSFKESERKWVMWDKETSNVMQTLLSDILKSDRLALCGVDYAAWQNNRGARGVSLWWLVTDMLTEYNYIILSKVQRNKMSSRNLKQNNNIEMLEHPEIFLPLRSRF